MLEFIRSFISGIIQQLSGGDKHACGLPSDLEIPPAQPQESVPEISTSAQALSFNTDPDSEPVFSAQAAGCTATVRPELANVNLRLGPGMKFEPPIARTQGGVRFEVVGASEPDPDDLRWFAVRLGGGSAWIRSDTITLAQECINLSFITPDDLRPPAPPPDARFPLPTTARITQGYSFPAHPGFDMGSADGTPLVAPADGVCIRRIDCTRCTPQQPNRRPNASFQCPDTWSDPGWGFGYGNFIIVRFDYARLPRTLRDEMDRQNLRNAFAYILYAHLSRINVALGQQFQAGHIIGNTGNTGCSTAPHLHFEVRIGRDENVDGRWQSQKAVHPRLIFNTP